MSENKTTKPAWPVGRYFKYAIGEILLVVIGILIALQINNWNENRKTRIEEQQAQVNLKRDFAVNKEELLELMNMSQISVNSGLQILNHTGKKLRPTSEESFNRLINGVFNIDPYTPQNGFLNDLINSGKLGIFSQAEFRNLLSSWIPEIESIMDTYTTADDNVDLLTQYINKNGNWLNTDVVISKERSFDFPSSGFDFDNRRLLDHREFENLVENLVFTNDVFLIEQKELMILLDSILAFIEKEIEG